MKNIWVSVNKKPLNLVLILAVLCLYVLNNYYFKHNTEGHLQYFMVCYFNDLLAPISLISYTNILLISIHYELKKISWIVLLGFVSGLIWEFSAPFFKTSSTTDIIDLFIYMLGAFLYWLMNHFFQTKDSL